MQNVTGFEVHEVDKIQYLATQVMVSSKSK